MTEEQKAKQRIYEKKFQEGKVNYKLWLTKDKLESWKKFARWEGFMSLSSYINHVMDERIKAFSTKVIEDGYTPGNTNPPQA